MNINGLIYYKLDVNSNGYLGDFTKNCGLRGEEIDSNFHFLRGHDIEKVSFNENGDLVLTRYNGEDLIAQQTSDSKYDFKFDAYKGELIITAPGGEEIVLEGFQTGTKVYHDSSLEGNGEKEMPLQLSNVVKTGRYKPAIKLIDTTVDDTKNVLTDYLPTENVAKNDRYVTKEKINRFGKLYPLSGVKKIEERLKEINSKWRVPTKRDWDILLNSIDCVKPEHGKRDSNVLLGEIAGAALKSTKYWEPFNGKVLSDDEYGFSIYPLGYSYDQKEKHYDYFGKSAAYWTSTEEDDENDMFVKIFNYDSEKVEQNTWSENYYLGLRLVRDYNNVAGFNESEIIDGETVNCLHIPGQPLIWSKENIGFSQLEYDGFVPEAWGKYSNKEDEENSFEIRYFINDWNGKDWDRHEIKEGEGIVLYESENELGKVNRMREWILVDGELVDSVIFEREEWDESITYLIKATAQEISDRKEEDAKLQKQIDETNIALNTEIEVRKEEDVKLQEQLDKTNEDIASINSTINHNKVKSDSKTIIVDVPTENGTNIEVNIDNKTIKSNDGQLFVNEDALTHYYGYNAIEVKDDDNGKDKTISLKINDNDNIIVNDVNGLMASISLKWVHADGEGAKDEIQLIGKNNTVISRIDVADFIKDGMLDDVRFDMSDPSNPILIFEFNTDSDKTTVEIPVKDLIDTYKAGYGLDLIDNTFTLKIDSTSEAYLTVSEQGLKISGIKSIEDSLSNRITTIEKDYLKSIDKNELREDLSIEITARENADKQIREEFRNYLVNEESARENAIKYLADEITAEINRAKEEESELKTSIQTEATTRENVDKELNSAISAIEKDYLKESDKTELESKIATNTKAISVNNNAITEEATTRENADKVLENRVISLENEVSELKTQIETLLQTITDLQNTVIKEVKGTSNEIDVKREGNTVIVGFADDTYFKADFPEN